MRSIRGAIFDLDGTLFDSSYDWPAIKEHLGVTRDDGSILDHLETLSPEAARSKIEWLEAYEDRATREGTLKPGARRLLGELSAAGIKLALVTNNRERNARSVISRFGLEFDAVVTRDDRCYKPSPEPMRQACVRLGERPAEVAAIGDNRFDLESARGARLGLVLTVNASSDELATDSDLFARDLLELRPLLREALSLGS